MTKATTLTFQVEKVLGFPLPFYKSTTLLLSFGISLRVLWRLFTDRPDIIHVSSPGLIVFAAVVYAKLLAVPLVVSYHTHIPEYIPRYTWRGLVEPMWKIIRWCTRQADLTLVTSQAMKMELSRNKCLGKRIDVWQKGVDTSQFHPRFRDAAMRERMTDGHPEAPLLVCVGRLGAEKNLTAFRAILDALPGARLALVGDGPQREELEAFFHGYPVKFMGMLKGRDLSQAYASGDIFLMPSETETLGFVVLEAMASGLPVVAVAAGGLTDIFTKPGKTGLLYQPGDYKAAVAHCQALLADPAYLRQIASSGRAEVERWGWGAATQVLRSRQYRLAIRRFRLQRRLVRFFTRLRIARVLKQLQLVLLGAWAAAMAAVGLATAPAGRAVPAT